HSLRDPRRRQNCWPRHRDESPLNDAFSLRASLDARSFVFPKVGLLLIPRLRFQATILVHHCGSSISRYTLVSLLPRADLMTCLAISDSCGCFSCRQPITVS